KAAVRLDGMSEMNGFRVRKADDRRRMEARANRKSTRKLLVAWPARDDRRAVMRCRAGGVAPGPEKKALGFGRVKSPAFALCRVRDRGPFAIEVDQLLGHGLTFRRVAVQQLWRASPPEDGCELPSEIEGILHGDVHALPRLRAVGVAGIAGDEHARQA